MYRLKQQFTRMHTAFVLAGVFVLVVVFGAQHVLAAFNSEINYQGKLTDSSNIAVTDGVYHMRFRLYDDETGGTALWNGDRSSDTGNRVDLVNGLFSIMLGSSTPLTGVDFDQTLWLEVEVGGTASSGWETLSPRKRLGAVPAAFVADTVDGLDASQFLRSDEPDTMASSSISTLLTINQSGSGDIINLLSGGDEVFTVTSEGTLGIGTTSPYAALSVVGEVVASHFTGTTTATSTFGGNLAINGTGTTTSAGGFDISTGCYAVNGVCLSTGGGGGGSSNWTFLSGTVLAPSSTAAGIGIQADFFNATSTTATSTFTHDVAIGTTTSQGRLTVELAQYADEETGFVMTEQTGTPLARMFLDQISANRYNTSLYLYRADDGVNDERYNGTKIYLASDRFSSSQIIFDNGWSAGDAFITYPGSGGPLTISTNYAGRDIVLSPNGTSAGVFDGGSGFVGLGGDTTPDAHLEVTANGGTGGAILYLSSDDNNDGDILTVLENGFHGIGTTSPYAKLSLHANNGDTNTTLFSVASSTASATTTLFDISNTGNVTLGAGTLRLPDGAFQSPVLTRDSDTSGFGMYFTDNGYGGTSCVVWGYEDSGPKTGKSAELCRGYDGFKFDFGRGYLQESNGTMYLGNDVYSTSFIFGLSTTNSIYVDDDTDTQIRWNEGDKLTISAGGREHIKVNGADLTIAAVPLSVHDDGTSHQVAIQGTAGQASDIFIVEDSSGNDFLTVDENGNLGIGTTSPYAALSVVGEVVASHFTGTTTATSTFGGNLAINGTGTTTSAGGFDISTGCYAVNGVCLSTGGGGGGSGTVNSGTTGQVAYYAADGTAVSGTSTLFISGGRVGIGTVVPQEALTVSGNIENIRDTNVAPTSVASVSLGGTSEEPRDMVIRGRYLYIADAGDNVLRIFDVSNPASPSAIGTFSVGNTPIALDVTGNYAYVVDQADDNLRIIDISNPTNPQLTASVTIGDTPNDIDVQGAYAYIYHSGTSDELAIYNVADPSNPTFEGSVVPSSDGGINVVVQGTYAYITYVSSGGFTTDFGVVDISNPSSPVLVDNVIINDDLEDIVVSGRYAYLLDDTSGSDNVRIYDVSDPTNVASVGATGDIGGSFAGMFISGRYVFVVDGSGGQLDIIDVLNASSPSAAGSFSLGTVSGFDRVVVSGRYAYVTDNTADQLEVIDIGGLETTSALVHALEAGTLQVREDAYFGQGLSVFGGLSVGGSGIFSTGPIVAGVASSTQSGAISGLFEGRVGIGTTTPYSKLSVVGGIVSEYISATSSTATSTLAGGLNVGGGAIYYDIGANETSIEKLLLGPQSFDDDAGVVTWIDLPVTNAPSAGTVESYTAAIDNVDVFTIYGEADGSGGLQNPRVVVGTSTAAVLGSSNIPYNSFIVADGIICVDDGAGSDCDNSTRTRGGVYAETGSLGGLDVAETYPTKDTDLEAGDIVMLDVDNPLFVTKFDLSGNAVSPAPVLGIVSTKPGLLLGGFKQEELLEGELQVPVALAGRVPVKISDENGPVIVGDRLTFSTTTLGAAVKAGAGNETIAIALEPYDGVTSGAFANDVITKGAAQDIPGESPSVGIPDASEVATILAFVERRSAPPFAQVDLRALSLEEEESHSIVQLILAILDSVGVRLAAGAAWFQDIFARSIVANDALTVGTADRPTGVTLYDEATGEPYCFSIRDGEPLTTQGACAGGNEQQDSDATTTGSGGEGEETNPESNATSTDPDPGSSATSTDPGSSSGDIDSEPAATSTDPELEQEEEEVESEPEFLDSEDTDGQAEPEEEQEPKLEEEVVEEPNPEEIPA